MFFALPYFLENARDFEIIAFVIGIVIWVQLLRHCLAHEHDTTQKILWVIFMIAAPGVGSLIYFFVRVTRLRG